MEVGREGHSGLYTMHFSNLFPAERGTVTTTTSSSSTTDAQPASASPQNPPSSTITTTTATASGATLASSSTALHDSLVQFSKWHVLIRMNVENDVCFVKGDAKVFSPTPSLASAEARGMYRNGEVVRPPTQPDTFAPVPVHLRDRKCHVFIEGRYSLPEGNSTTGNNNNSSEGGGSTNGNGHASALATAAALNSHNATAGTNATTLLSNGCSSTVSPFRLEVHFERLEAELLGLSEPAEVKNVVLSCSGYKACGWHMGAAIVSVDGTELKMPVPLRFLLKPFYGTRCVQCLDPVYSPFFICDGCHVARYCSAECMKANMNEGQHGLLCPYLRANFLCQAGAVATEVSDDTGLVAWWRCVDDVYFNILADSRHALDYAIEFTLSTLRSAKEYGLQYRFILPKPSEGDTEAAENAPRLPSEEEVVDFACVLLREVNRSAILEGCVSLSAACLNYLYVFSPSPEITIQAHVLFFTAFHLEEFEGPISTIEEYVAYARPLHALATLQIEYALKSPISAEFWRRIKIAKDVVISLFTVNASGPCAEVEAMREVVMTQQCETLTLLCKVFVIMATRAPQDEARRWLEQGEKCLRQCCESDAIKRDGYLHGILCFRLATLLLLFREDAKTEESRQLKAKGENLLRAARDAKETSAAKKTPSALQN